MVISSNIRDISFCDAIANIDNEMVLKFCINAIEKLYVKRQMDEICLGQSPQPPKAMWA